MNVKRAAGVSVLALGACNWILGTPDPVLRIEGLGDDASGAPDASGGERVDEAAAAEASAVDAFDAACRDLMTDPANCGTCGHDCLGGACDAGKCGPAVVAGSPTADNGLARLVGAAVVGDILYVTNWSPTNALFAVPKSAVDGGMTTLLGGGDAGIIGAMSIAAAGTSVFVGASRAPPSNDAIFELETTTGALKPLVSSQAATLAADAQYVYYTPLDGTVYIFDRASSAPLGQLSTRPNTYAAELASDGDLLLYQFGYSVDEIILPDLTSVSVACPGLSMSTFAIFRPLLFVMSVDETNPTNLVGHVYKCDYLQRGAPTEITPDSGLALAGDAPRLLVDDRHVYVADSTTTAFTIRRFARDGTAAPAELLVAIDDMLGAITQDDRAIYFTTRGWPGDAGPFATVYRLAK